MGLRPMRAINKNQLLFIEGDNMPKCLIVVDYQNDFVTGSLGYPAAAALEKNIAAKIAKYRESGDAIIFTLDTHGEDYSKTQEGRNLPVPHCIENTPGHALYGQVADMCLEGDKAFRKNTFGSGALYEYLKENRFDSIELVGVVSNICVISNAILAKTAQPETPIIVDSACTASNDADLHKAGLAVMAGLQIMVI